MKFSNADRVPGAVLTRNTTRVSGSCDRKEESLSGGPSKPLGETATERQQLHANRRICQNFRSDAYHSEETSRNSRRADASRYSSRSSIRDRSFDRDHPQPSKTRAFSAQGYRFDGNGAEVEQEWVYKVPLRPSSARSSLSCPRHHGTQDSDLFANTTSSELKVDGKSYAHQKSLHKSQTATHIRSSTQTAAFEKHESGFLSTRDPSPPVLNFVSSDKEKISCGQNIHPLTTPQAVADLLSRPQISRTRPGLTPQTLIDSARAQYLRKSVAMRNRFAVTHNFKASSKTAGAASLYSATGYGPSPSFGEAKSFNVAEASPVVSPRSTTTSLNLSKRRAVTTEQWKFPGACRTPVRGLEVPKTVFGLL